jgi:ABC-2 type transport system ATP-binding protein
MELSITLCDAFSLPIDNLTNTLSTGQKKKLALIANLIVDKNIYFFDEPFNGLDFESYEMLQKLLKSSFFSTKYVIISSHILDSLSSVCDEILLIKDGEIAKVFNQEHFADIKVFYSDSINLGVQNIMNAIEEWKIDHSKE